MGLMVNKAGLEAVALGVLQFFAVVSFRQCSILTLIQRHYIILTIISSVLLFLQGVTLYNTTIFIAWL